MFGRNVKLLQNNVLMVCDKRVRDHPMKDLINKTKTHTQRKKNNKPYPSENFSSSSLYCWCRTCLPGTTAL